MRERAKHFNVSKGDIAFKVFLCENYWTYRYFLQLCLYNNKCILYLLYSLVNYAARASERLLKHMFSMSKTDHWFYTA